MCVCVCTTCFQGQPLRYKGRSHLQRQRSCIVGQTSEAATASEGTSDTLVLLAGSCIGCSTGKGSLICTLAVIPRPIRRRPRGRVIGIVQNYLCRSDDGSPSAVDNFCRENRLWVGKPSLVFLALKCFSWFCSAPGFLYGKKAVTISTGQAPARPFFLNAALPFFVFCWAVGLSCML